MQWNWRGPPESLILATFYKGMEKVGNPKIPLEAPKADSWKMGFPIFSKRSFSYGVAMIFGWNWKGIHFPFRGLQRIHFQPTVLAGIIDFCNVFNEFRGFPMACWIMLGHVRDNVRAC